MYAVPLIQIRSLQELIVIFAILVLTEYFGSVTFTTVRFGLFSVPAPLIHTCGQWGFSVADVPPFIHLIQLE